MKTCSCSLNSRQVIGSKLWSANPLERLNKEIKRRTNVVGIFPTPVAPLRLAEHILIEQHDEWDSADRRYFSEISMKLIGTNPEEVNITAIDATQTRDH